VCKMEYFFLEILAKRIKEFRKKTVSKEGKFTVLGVDKFSDEDFICGRYDTAEEALKFAREKTREAMKGASDCSIATVYYAYTPKGRYLGGDFRNLHKF